MPKNKPKYKPGLNWQLEIEGVTQGAFTKANGLNAGAKAKQPLGRPPRPQPPGAPSLAQGAQGSITFLDGYINNTELRDWNKAVMDGKIERKAGSVILCGDDGSEIMRYTFTRAYPSAIKGFSLNGKGKPTVDEIKLQVTGLKKV